jgi:hypothetical protein
MPRRTGCPGSPSQRWTTSLPTRTPRSEARTAANSAGVRRDQSGDATGALSNEAGLVTADRQAESRARPLRRRALSTARPEEVAIRARKPCFLARRRLLGWNVRFIGCRFRGRSHRSTPVHRRRSQGGNGNSHGTQLPPESSGEEPDHATRSLHPRVRVNKYPAHRRAPAARHLCRW